MHTEAEGDALASDEKSKVDDGENNICNIVGASFHFYCCIWRTDRREEGAEFIISFDSFGFDHSII